MSMASPKCLMMSTSSWGSQNDSKQVKNASRRTFFGSKFEDRVTAPIDALRPCHHTPAPHDPENLLQMSVRALAYVGVAAQSLDEWRAFAGDLLGAIG